MNEKIYDLNLFGDETFKIILGKTSYRNNGTLAVTMIDVLPDGTEEDFGVLTVNLECNLGLANKTDTQFIDTNNLTDKIIKWLVDNNIAKPTGLMWPSGYFMYPSVVFTKEALVGMRRL